MNTLRNKVQIIGHLGADPEVKTLSNGNTLAKMRIATNEVYKSATGEKMTETQWHSVVAWGKTAEIAAKYLNKGNEVIVEGRISYSEFTGADGQKRYYTDIVASELLMLDRKQAA